MVRRACVHGYSGGEKRRKVGKFFEPEDVSVGKLEMELSIPQALKRLLLVDMKHHRSQNVLVLPRTPSAGQVLRDFQDYSSSGCHSLSSFKIPGFVGLLAAYLYILRFLHKLSCHAAVLLVSCTCTRN